jgi:hypothetical protein
MSKVEKLEHEAARLRSDFSGARRGHAYWYEKNRLLENAVRAQARACFAASTPDEAQAAMEVLLRRVPVKPRKKWSLGRMTLRGRR